MSDEFVRSRQQFLDEQCVVSDKEMDFYFSFVAHRAFMCFFPARLALAWQIRPVDNASRLDTYFRIAEQLFMQYQAYLSDGDLQRA